MVNQLIWAFLLTILPISELRAGMPIAIDYALKNSLPLIPIIFFIILANMLIVLFIFWFLDSFHHILIRNRVYRKFYESYLRRIQKKVDKFEKNHAAYGFTALMLFVAVPLPTTGAWTGTVIAWLLGLNRKQSLIAIMLGVLIAGIIVSLISLGILSFVY